MARTAVLDHPEKGDTGGANAPVAAVDPAEECSHVGHEGGAEYHREPITAVGYNAAGESVDRPVDTRPSPELPGFEADEDPNAEMFEGKRVIGHKWSFTGNHEVNIRNQALRDKLDVLGRGEPTLLLVQVEPGDVTHAQSTEDGHIKGVFHKRKLHITDVFAAEDIEGSEALFEGGLLRVRRPAVEDDGIGYLTEEPDDDDEGNDLASSLMAAGLCGKRHKGHKNTCRVAAHACEEPEAEEDE